MRLPWTEILDWIVSITLLLMLYGLFLVMVIVWATIIFIPSLILMGGSYVYLCFRNRRQR